MRYFILLFNGDIALYSIVCYNGVSMCCRTEFMSHATDPTGLEIRMDIYFVV